MNYNEFLAKKTKVMLPPGIKPGPIHSTLYPFQKHLVELALQAGRYCIWAECGLGKTFMQVAWANQIPGNVLIAAPLAVAQQTIQEGKKIDVPIRYCRHQEETQDGITITNYQMLEHFDASFFKGVVLDESSILKSLDGKTKDLILAQFSRTPYRLACTATPAPNDYMEIGNHAEFVGVCRHSEMLANYFVHDGGETQKWRLKKHAESKFWEWVCSWAVMLRKPSDIGFLDEGFDLPKLEYISHVVDTKWQKDDYVGLLPYEASSLSERITARKHSVKERVDVCASLVNSSDDCWVIWCNLNSESDMIAKKLKDSVQISGSDSIDVKMDRLTKFSTGKTKRINTKPSIAGHGLNWQHCHNVAFIGLSDSWEQFYQAVRRCWRFGQKYPVKVHLIISRAEGPVLKNIMRKEAEADRMMNSMVSAMSRFQKNTKQLKEIYMEDTVKGKNWTCMLGDSVERLSELKPDSIDYSIFSPPFASLYVYSDSMRDMGNCKNDKEFFDHFKFQVQQQYRVMKPGRLVSFHCMNLPTSKTRHGYIGIHDFRGEMIRVFQEAGFIYHSEVVIWKDPVTAMQRTKALGLLWKQLKKDSCMSRQGIPDYLVTMRKPGKNPNPVGRKPEEFPVRLWQQWASPIWMDINPSDTLQFRSVREHKDERHICPLQLNVIRRGILLWSNPGDIVLSPYMGIGSEGVVAVQCDRKFIGIELKKSYWKQSVANLKHAEKGKYRTLLPVHELVSNDKDT